MNPVSTYCLHHTLLLFFSFTLSTVSLCECLSNTNVTGHVNKASWNWKKKEWGVQCDGDMSRLHDVSFMKWDGKRKRRKFKGTENVRETDRVRRSWVEQTAFYNHTVHSVCATKKLSHCYVNQNETFMSKPSSHSEPTEIALEWPIWWVGYYMKVIYSKQRHFERFKRLNPQRKTDMWEGSKRDNIYWHEWKKILCARGAKVIFKP